MWVIKILLLCLIVLGFFKVTSIHPLISSLTFLQIIKLFVFLFVFVCFFFSFFPYILYLHMHLHYTYFLRDAYTTLTCITYNTYNM